MKFERTFAPSTEFFAAAIGIGAVFCSAYGHIAIAIWSVCYLVQMFIIDGLYKERAVLLTQRGEAWGRNLELKKRILAQRPKENPFAEMEDK